MDGSRQGHGHGVMRKIKREFNHILTIPFLIISVPAGIYMAQKILTSIVFTWKVMSCLMQVADRGDAPFAKHPIKYQFYL